MTHDDLNLLSNIFSQLNHKYRNKVGRICAILLLVSDVFELQISGKVLKSRTKHLRNWQSTFNINFDFAVNAKTDLTRQVFETSYYEYQDTNVGIYPNFLINCTSVIRFEDFNIEYCSKGTDSGTMKFTSNFFGRDSGQNRESVEVPMLHFNTFQHFEVTQTKTEDGSGLITINQNGETQHTLTDSRINRDAIIKIETNINSFATLKDVKITE